MANKLKITLIKSMIGRPEKTSKSIEGDGADKIEQDRFIGGYTCDSRDGEYRVSSRKGRGKYR